MSEAASIGLVGGLLAAIATHHVILARAVLRQRRGSRLAVRYPSVTVIRPIKGIDSGAELNVAAALDHGYPGEVETFFVFDHPADPAHALVKTAIEAHRGAGGAGPVEILFCGPPPAGMTGKLNAMMAGVARARGELLAFADSDTRPDGTALRVLVETLLSDPASGSAFAPVFVAGEARTAGDAGYALMLNALYGPLAARLAVAAARHPATPEPSRGSAERPPAPGAQPVADDPGDSPGRRPPPSSGVDGPDRPRAMPFVMGQLMVVRREALAAVGGLGCARGQLVDDMHIGARLSAAGYLNLMSPHPVAIHAEGLRFDEFLDIFSRWMAFGRALPFGFNVRGWIRGLELWVAVVLMFIFTARGAALAALLSLLCAVALGGSLSLLHRLSGGTPLGSRHAWMTVGLLLLGPGVVLATLLRREVSWRGRTYRLDAAARLAS